MAWSFTADRPVYIQIADRIKKSVLSGQYKAGEQIPAVHQLALEAAVNPNTVQRAFRHLESLGLIETIPKKGVYVTYTLASNGAKPLPEWAQTIVLLKKSGVTYEELKTVIKEVYSHD